MNKQVSWPESVLEDYKGMQKNKAEKEKMSLWGARNECRAWWSGSSHWDTAVYKQPKDRKKLPVYFMEPLPGRGIHVKRFQGRSLPVTFPEQQTDYSSWAEKAKGGGGQVRSELGGGRSLSRGNVRTLALPEWDRKWLAGVRQKRGMA